MTNRLETRTITSEPRRITSSGILHVESSQLNAYLPSSIPRLLIPRTNLYGIQTMKEYGGRRRSRIEKELAEQGINYLLANPILTCAVSGNAGIQLFIIDGHHRARYSGRFYIGSLPCLIATPKQLIDSLRAVDGNNIFSEDTLVESLVNASAETLISFKHIITDKQPSIIQGANNIADLNNRFAHF